MPCIDKKWSPACKTQCSVETRKKAGNLETSQWVCSSRDDKYIMQMRPSVSQASRPTLWLTKCRGDIASTVTWMGSPSKWAIY